MPPAKRTRYADPDYVPTRAQFAEPCWHVYKTFRVPAFEETFSRYEFVYLRQPPEEDSDAEVGRSATKKREAKVERTPWIGKIMNIKAVRPTNVCISIQWLYTSREQLVLANVGNIPDELRGNEVVLGLTGAEYDDIQSHTSVEDHADVKAFNERNPLQELIEPTDYFYRSELKYVTQATNGSLPGKRKKTKSTRLVVVPFHDPTCFCKNKYEPLPLQEDPAMVMCPRPDCCDWYHLSCLSASPNKFQHPTTDDVESALMATHFDPLTSPPSVNVRLDESMVIEPDVHRYARSHIFRGDTETGIAGNGLVVLGARDIVATPAGERQREMLAAWRNRFGPDGEMWDGVLGGTGEKGGIILGDVTSVGSSSSWQCPKCHGWI